MHGPAWHRTDLVAHRVSMMLSPSHQHRRRDTALAHRFGHGALRALLSTSTPTAIAILVGSLAFSWLATFLIGGADSVVPHWYYVPIVFAAARFGPLAALAVALVSGILAGPFTLVSVAGEITQEPARWLSRTAFFVVIGQVMAGLVSPSLPSVAAELSRLRQEWAIRHALADGQFFLVYQPIVRPQTSHIVAVEALVRWAHPTEGVLAPGAFLEVAESSEVINDLGAFVVDTACRQAARWNEAGGDPSLSPQVNVNLSARELENDGVVDRIRASLEHSGLPPGQLCLEITESVLVDDVDACLAKLQQLKELGVCLAVDDFGTGYSSLSAVHRYPIDEFKVDRSFVSRFGGGDGAEAICGGMVMLARSLGVTIVAEGIETEAQVDAVLELGFDWAQGFYFARPMRAEQLTPLVAAARRRPVTEDPVARRRDRSR